MAGRLTWRLGGGAGWDGALHQERRDLGVDLWTIFLEQLVRLKLRSGMILLLETGMLHIAAQIVHVPKVFFPVLINDG